MGAKEIKPKTWTPPETAEMKAYKEWKPQRDPRLPHIFQGRKDQYAASYKNPFGAFTTPMVRDQSIRANNDRLDQEYGQASMAENAAFENMRGSHLGNVAAMYRPQMYMPQYRENPWMTGLGMAVSLGGSAMGAF